MASWRLKSKVNAFFKISDKEKYFKTHEAKIDFLILTSKSQGHFEARMWPPRGHNPKLMLFSKSLTQRTYILTPRKQKLILNNLDLLEVIWRSLDVLREVIIQN